MMMMMMMMKSVQRSKMQANHFVDLSLFVLWEH